MNGCQAIKVFEVGDQKRIFITAGADVRVYDEQGELLKRRLPAWVHERARVHFSNRRGVNNELEPMWAYDEDTLEHFREIELAVAALFPKPEKILATKNAYCAPEREHLA